MKNEEQQLNSLDIRVAFSFDFIASLIFFSKIFSSLVRVIIFRTERKDHLY